MHRGLGPSWPVRVVGQDSRQFHESAGNLAGFTLALGADGWSTSLWAGALDGEGHLPHVAPWGAAFPCNDVVTASCRDLWQPSRSAPDPPLVFAIGYPAVGTVEREVPCEGGFICPASTYASLMAEVSPGP
jgi:hypothetical protein